MVTVSAPTSTLATATALPLQLSGEFLQYALVFFVLAIVAAVLGARGVAGLSMTIAKWLVIVFLVLALVSLLL
ncbi:DUF1328 domain-containing protein [Halobaculum lipolyticum]|uniref:UPF0391 membrane protein ACFQL9_17225 n=1 Tax=Halobaculum lipolyticum TaxID=3032001 RepID=A0ABD5WHL7_9EURY|nr:DUF1328 domain-containing protein [Halobaculum sp. DT31]